MLQSWRLGKAFGIDLYAHWSLLVLPAFALLYNLTFGWPMAALAAAVTLALFGCVLLHELGHALAARAFGIRTKDISLYVIGGVARLERLSERPGEEIAIALAGPLVNVVIAFGLGLGLVLAGRPLGVAGGQFESLPWGAAFVTALMSLNIVLVVFNMLPAFPMDGGRVLRAVLSLPLGRLRATEIAAGLGLVMSALFMVAGLFGSWSLMLVAGFVALAGQQELGQVRAAESYRRSRPPVWVEVPADPHYTGYTWGDGHWIE